METDPKETPIDLTGSVALVTGGGRGLGRAFALALAAAGAQVVVTARTTAQVAETVELIECAGGSALALPSDVSVPDEVTHLVATAEQLGPVDILVNNAGVAGPMGSVWEVDPEDWWHTMAINLRGPFRRRQAWRSAKGGSRLADHGLILVTGAAGQLGAVGCTVTGRLLERGLPVRALVRREDDRAALRAAGASARGAWAPTEGAWQK
jgi:NAD(P)-dependent dehydrogenase (short-subunit alcohol dehydrogenase family)